MAFTEIQIVNLALARLGDVATAANISVPTTQQEKWAAQFYPLARDITLERHAWDFATVRKALATSSVTPPSTWRYAYDLPANMMTPLAVLHPEASNDYAVPVVFESFGAYAAPLRNVGVQTPQNYAIEWDETGSKRVLYTDVEEAVLRYTISVTNTALFSAEFVDALALRLASMIAGPLIKADIGSKVAQQMEALADAKLMRAAASDADQRQQAPTVAAPWIAGRG